MRRSLKRTGGPFEEVFLHAYPNPERIGCPGSEVLRGLATKDLPISHPAREHITRCSPCFQEFRAFEKGILREKSKKTWIRAGLGLAAAATVAIVIAIIPLSHHHGPQQTIGVWKIPSATRDVDNGMTAKPLSISRQEGVVRITLPLGSDDGQYEIQIRRSPEGPVIQSYIGKAEIAKSETQLPLEADFRDLPPGLYAVAYRHGDATWHIVPLVVN